MRLWMTLISEELCRCALWSDASCDRSWFDVDTACCQVDIQGVGPTGAIALRLERLVVCCELFDAFLASLEGGLEIGERMFAFDICEDVAWQLGGRRRGRRSSRRRSVGGGSLSHRDGLLVLGKTAEVASWADWNVIRCWTLREAVARLAPSVIDLTLRNSTCLIERPHECGRCSGWRQFPHGCAFL